MLQTLIYLICVLLVIGLAWWVIDYAAVPPPLNRWAKIIVIVVGAIILISVLLSLGGVNLGIPK
jgi:hypothetical protein